MPRLVKIVNGDVAVAHRYVATPTYRLNVADYASKTPPDGWTYVAANVSAEDYHHVWKQPAGAHDAYQFGATVQHKGEEWRNVIEANVWEPGVTGWVPLKTAVRQWSQPTGATDAYGADALVQKDGKVWRSTVKDNVWAPGISGWREVVGKAPDGTVAVPAWVQPTGGHDAYALNSRVTHKGKTWTSTAAANVWEPGVYGWVAD